MVTQTAQPILFDFLPHLPVVVQQHHGQFSSDAGLLPIRQFDLRWNYTARMVQCLDDPNPSRDHSPLSMLRQRVYGILAGYEGCNETDRCPSLHGLTVLSQSSKTESTPASASMDSVLARVS